MAPHRLRHPKVLARPPCLFRRCSKMVKVLIDSNFLMTAIQFRIDIIRELGHLLGRRVEPILISPVEDELRSISSGIESKRSREAGQALKLAHMMRVETVTRSPNESVDETLTRVALERGWAVATNDRILRRKLGELAVPTIYLRKKAHLEVKGTIK